MNKQQTAKSPGWNFDNSYLRLPQHFYARMAPVAVCAPKVVILNNELAQQLGLALSDCSEEELARHFSGNSLQDGAEPIAQAYAGHQFGHFTMLGDGRAHLLGEHLTPQGERFDIQLKGSGKTPYGKRGDGRAALGPMLREYIVSEAMHALGIATTRSLAVVTSGETVYRETALQGAILVRVAASHLRVGTFEYLAACRDAAGLKRLADYTIDRHYQKLKTSATPYLDLITSVMQQQISLIVEWLRVGFIHGVMNTDNMAISGATIDYGPCAFMDKYDPQTVFSSIDHAGRYAFANQSRIAGWNLARFAETMLPLLHHNIEQAAAMATEALQPFNTLFQQAWLGMMRRKLGLFGAAGEDEQLVNRLLDLMQRQQQDYTNTFLDLTATTLPPDAHYQTPKFQAWWQSWQERRLGNNQPVAASLSLMQAANPVVIPRNHRVAAALAAAESSDLGKLYELLEVLAQPYQDKQKYRAYRNPPQATERVLQTFCGT